MDAFQKKNFQEALQVLSIGEFSRICKVTTKTLRYYAEIGLIIPDQINPETGYRYYAIDQLKKMLLINRLKAYDLSLEEIKAVIDAGPDGEALVHLLARQRRILQTRVEELKGKLGQIETDLANLEKGIPVLAYLDAIEVQLAEVPPQNILSLRRKMSAEECLAGYGGFFGKLYQRIIRGNLTVMGFPTTIYHSPEYTPVGYDIEFAIPVQEAVTGTRDFITGLCARSELRGPYTELTAAYARQRAWAEAEGYVFSGALFEIYQTDPGAVAPDENITVVYSPIRKISG